MLEFSLPTNDILLSKIFSYLDNAKSILNLQDYTISQTTLDQVFVNFASQESRDTLLEKNKRPEKQLPYLNDLKSRINGLQIDETRFNDELMQKKPISNLMKSSSVHKSQFNYLKPQLTNQLSTSHTTTNNRNLKKQLTNKNYPNLNPISHFNNSSLYFNPQQQLNNLNNIHFLNSSNIYCSIERSNPHFNPLQSAGNILHKNNVQSNNVHNIQPLIILPTAKRKK